MTKTLPPFRADHVGSLLRTKDVQDARQKHADGQISANDLTAIEDAAIRRLIAKQEDVGLHSVTDGEFRRTSWNWDFLSQLGGTEISTGQAAPFKGIQPSKPMRIIRVVGKLDFPSNHTMIEHFKFLKANTKQTAKLTIPSPTMLVSAMRDWRQVVDTKAYPSMDDLFHDLGLAYRKAIKAFADVGCTYLQMDDCNLSYLCDSSAAQKMKERGDDPDQMLKQWVGVINSALTDKPKGMTITTHICRGNFRSSWLASGGYEPIAETIFNQLKYDGFFLEFDDERSGDFQPLRHVPKSGTAHIVLGLVTSKTGTLESKDLIKQRIEQASKFVSLDRLCLSPQCGFASTEEGNILAEDEQWAKLKFITDTAKEVWTDA